MGTTTLFLDFVTQFPVLLRMKYHFIDQRPRQVTKARGPKQNAQNKGIAEVYYNDGIDGAFLLSALGREGV